MSPSVIVSRVKLIMKHLGVDPPPERRIRAELLVTTAVTTLLAIVVAIVGWLYPTLIPLCFAPEEAGQAVVVCPTQQSAPFSTTQSRTTPAKTTEDTDDATCITVTSWDLVVVELVGLTAAALAATATIRRLKGSSERYGLPVALAALMLPTGAITAFLGLLLMRGQSSLASPRLIHRPGWALRRAGSAPVFQRSEPTGRRGRSKES
jgi:hypothetical protein